MEFILLLITDKGGLQRHADLSDMENLAVLLGSLCSKKQLPTDIAGIDQELFAKFYDQWKGTFDYTEKSAGTIDKEAEEVIDKKEIIENTDFKLLLTPMKEDLALQLRKQMEKSYLSLFQITSNARKFAGMINYIFTNIWQHKIFSTEIIVLQLFLIYYWGVSQKRSQLIGAMDKSLTRSNSS